MKRLVRNLIYLGVITAVEVGVFAHYNQLLSAAKTATVVTTAPPVKEKPNVLSSINPLQPNLVAVSDDGQRVAYVTQSNKLVAVDVTTGKTLYSLQLQMKPVYLSWIRNDSLFIGTEVPDGSLKDLRLSTITLSTGQLRLIHVFAGYATDATFRNVTFSPYTNDVYILIASKVASVMYHYDTNGNLTHVHLGGRYVTHAAATSTSAIVYFQDFALGTPNLLMLDHSGNVIVLQRNAALLRVIGNTLYYGKLDSQGNVTEVVSYKAPADLGNPAVNSAAGSGSSSSSTGSGSGPSGSSTSGSAGSGNGTVTTVATLPTAVSPSQVYITDSHDVLVVGSTGIDDLTTKQHITVPAGAQSVQRSNSLLLLSPSGGVQFFT
ncbi:hypothetical protein JZ785_23060 [Alicyclobacillus curvatus]|jgi:uncharacterized membrane protein YgcG|nr:hypothetical protein JZ785_23060 [Alicyclobacillus curvatus]